MQKFMADIGFKEQALYVQDTQGARDVHAGNAKVFWLGVTVLLTFFTTTTALLYGCYYLLVGEAVQVNQGLLAAVFSFVGTAFGYVAANAQQVISFFFGSSKGGEDSAQAMASAVKDLGVHREGLNREGINRVGGSRA